MSHVVVVVDDDDDDCGGNYNFSHDFDNVDAVFADNDKCIFYASNL